MLAIPASFITLFTAEPSPICVVTDSLAVLVMVFASFVIASAALLAIVLASFVMVPFAAKLLILPFVAVLVILSAAVFVRFLAALEIVPFAAMLAMLPSVEVLVMLFAAVLAIVSLAVLTSLLASFLMVPFLAVFVRFVAVCVVDVVFSPSLTSLVMLFAFWSSFAYFVSLAWISLRISLTFCLKVELRPSLSARILLLSAADWVATLVLSPSFTVSTMLYLLSVPWLMVRSAYTVGLSPVSESLWLIPSAVTVLLPMESSSFAQVLLPFSSKVEALALVSPVATSIFRFMDCVLPPLMVV